MIPDFLKFLTGMQTITGEFMCIEPSFGFMIWVEGKDMPVNVDTGKINWDNYKGPEYPKEGQKFEITGIVDTDGYGITAFDIQAVSV